MITPAEIQNKEFKRSLRGYNEEEVDMFLDRITLDLDKLIAENINLKARLAVKQKEKENIQGTDLSVSETLSTAKSLMDDIAKSSEQRAASLIRNAELDAGLIIKEAKAKADRIIEESKEITKAYETFRKEYKEILQWQLSHFETGQQISSYEQLKALIEGDISGENKSVDEEVRISIGQDDIPEEKAGDRTEEVYTPSLKATKDIADKTHDDKKTIVNIKYDE